jgi:hypothetical protein
LGVAIIEAALRVANGRFRLDSLLGEPRPQGQANTTGVMS